MLYQCNRHHLISFQNISCYCLTSIYCPFYLFKYISKHLMLLFNYTSNRTAKSNIDISKHLMLLFNTRVEAISQEVNKFQNISCYCLTFLNYIPFFGILFQNISCYCLTSLILSCEVCLLIFQNISCYCLTPFKVSNKCCLYNFKTSHVIV